MKKELDRLADARENGNLTPDELRQNLDQTIEYYKKQQEVLHQYNEGLRKDRDALISKINSLNLGEAFNVTDGQLFANRQLIIDLVGNDDELEEQIDDLISQWEEGNNKITENSQEWLDIQQKLIDLAEQYRDSYISIEDKIRDLLIQRDQEEIENTQKKYDALKKADEDYLSALRKNIDNRRKARDKEESYSDLAKKEKRLALLKRDTSGIYSAEILS